MKNMGLYKTLELRVEETPERRIMATGNQVNFLQKNGTVYDDGTWRICLFTKCNRNGYNSHESVDPVVSVTYRGQTRFSIDQTRVREIFSSGNLLAGLEDYQVGIKNKTRIKLSLDDYATILVNQLGIDQRNYDEPNGSFEFEPAEDNLRYRILTDGQLTCTIDGATINNPAPEDYAQIEGSSHVLYVVEDATWTVACSFTVQHEELNELKVTLITKSDNLGRTIDELDRFLADQEEVARFEDFVTMF